MTVGEVPPSTGGASWTHKLAPSPFSKEQTPCCQPQLCDEGQSLKFPVPKAGRQDLGGWNWSWRGPEAGKWGPLWPAWGELWSWLLCTPDLLLIPIWRK